jgi:carboxypeptidase C (cathepsin A)
MRGLFLEGGPLRIIRNGSKNNDFQLISAENSWADDYSIIFVD